MPLSLAFWLIFILCVFFCYWSGRPWSSWSFGSYGAIFVLIFLLGWRVFGFVIQG